MVIVKQRLWVVVDLFDSDKPRVIGIFEDAYAAYQCARAGGRSCDMIPADLTTQQPGEHPACPPPVTVFE